jgi:MFS family permease
VADRSSPDRETAPPAPPDYEGKWRAFTAIGVAFVTNVFAMTMVFVALPSIAEDFGVTLRAVAWVVIVQSLTVSALMLPMGRVADLVGRRRMHLMGLCLFGTASIGVVFAPSFGWLIAARAVMSVGNAMGQSVGTAMAVAVFPPHERGKAIGSQTTAVAIGAASGPMVGGLVLQVLPWEALFALLVIPISIALIAGYVVLDEATVTPPSTGPRPSFDWPGALVSGAMVIVLVLTVNNPLALPWLSPVVIGGAVATAVLFTIFVRWELRIPHPMLDLRLFTSRVFSTGIGARLAGFMGATVINFLAPIYLISLRGMSAAAAGGVMFLSSLGMAVSAQVTGRLADRYGPRPFGALGFVILMVAAVVFATMTRSTPLAVVMAVMLANGVSLGLWNVPTNTAVMGAVTPDRHGVVGAFTNLTRNMGNVTGQAMASAIVVGVMVGRGFDIPLGDIGTTIGAGAAFTAGWRLCFVMVAAFATAGLALVLASGTTDREPVPAT